MRYSETNKITLTTIVFVHIFLSNFVENGCSDENESVSSISLKPDNNFHIQQSALEDLSNMNLTKGCAKTNVSAEDVSSKKLENNTENPINIDNVSNEDDNDDEFENIFEQLKKQDKARFLLNILFIMVLQLYI